MEICPGGGDRSVGRMASDLCELSKTYQGSKEKRQSQKASEEIPYSSSLLDFDFFVDLYLNYLERQ